MFVAKLLQATPRAINMHACKQATLHAPYKNTRTQKQT